MAARIAADLALRPEVRSHWFEESACAGMTVGALTRHLVSQWSNAVHLLEAPAGGEPISVWEHYERAAWAHTTLDDDANAGIREGSEELAAEGPETMRALVEELAPQLDAVLAASVGLETPTFPDDVVGPVLDLLTGLSVRRHGSTALVRALTRPQRAPSSVTAF